MLILQIRNYRSILMLLLLVSDAHYSSFAQKYENNAFRLKMYWEPGYYWQESYEERRWCLQCHEYPCSSKTNLFIHTCDSKNPKQFFVHREGTIRPSSDLDLCVSRVGRSQVLLEQCDSKKSRMQRWKNVATDGNKFILIAEAGADGKCLTQQHHPKDGEVVYMAPCVLAREAHTEFWMAY